MMAASDSNAIRLAQDIYVGLRALVGSTKMLAKQLEQDDDHDAADDLQEAVFGLDGYEKAARQIIREIKSRRYAVAESMARLVAQGMLRDVNQSTFSRDGNLSSRLKAIQIKANNLYPMLRELELEED